MVIGPPVQGGSAAGVADFFFGSAALAEETIWASGTAARRYG